MEYWRWITQLTCKLDLKGSEQQITEMCVFVCLCTLVAVLSIMRCGVMYIIVKRVCFVIVLLRKSILDACDLQVLRGPALKTDMILSLHVCELSSPCHPQTQLYHAMKKLNRSHSSKLVSK